MSHLELVITDTAQGDLADIWDYRAEYDVEQGGFEVG